VQPPPDDAALKLEVGIEDALHIEFEYDRGAFHIRDTVTGRVNFLLVRLRLSTMEVALIRKETVGIGASPLRRWRLETLVIRGIRVGHGGRIAQ
jgi:vacuolar protein sorting-associated protein 26